MPSCLKETVKATLDFPKPGVCYWDTTPLFESPALLKEVLETFAEHIKQTGANCLAAIEAKGFPLGGALAASLGLPLIFIRKPGLTPGAVHEVQFVKEYGTAAYQLKKDLRLSQKRAYLLYDIFAGPGATLAAKELLEKSNFSVIGAGYLLELEYLNGREALGSLPILSLTKISRSKQHEYQIN